MNHLSVIRSNSITAFDDTVLFVRLAREKLGHLERNNSESYPIGSRMGENRDSIVFFPTNGVGFGHFTRLLAVANKIKKADPEMEIIFFTTMPTLHILADFEFPAYHVSGRYRYKDMDPNVWNSICEEMLNMIFSFTGRKHLFSMVPFLTGVC